MTEQAYFSLESSINIFLLISEMFLTFSVELINQFIKNAVLILAPFTNTPQGPWQTVGLDSAPGCSLPPCSRHSLHSTYPCASHPWCSYLCCSGCLRHTLGWSTPAMCATVLVPLGFFSMKLSDTETRYSAFDRELLAAFSPIPHFRFLPEGRDFILYTDHKPLTHALFRTTSPWSSHQQ